MTGAYYNENDPQAAAWIRELIRRGLVPAGDVDTRSIVDVRPSDVRGYRECHWFAGVAVWAFAIREAGWDESSGVTWTGSCPCQPFSDAGAKRGTADERHLWPVWRDLIAECRPDVVFGEQVSGGHALSWLDAVCDDLERDRYAVGTLSACAAGVGAPHIRQRLFWVADADGQRRQVIGEHGRRPTQTHGRGQAGDRRTGGYWRDADWIACRDGLSRPVEPGTQPMAHGSPGRVVRLRAYGNAIVAPVAIEFVRAFLAVRQERGVIAA